jgi:5-formyltetrahydrofolate cyclo-ligase
MKKQELRSEMLMKLEALDAKWRLQADAQATKLLMGSTLWGRSSTILFFVSTQVEIHTRQLIGAAFDTHRVLVPRCDTEQKLLIPCQIQHLDDLEPGSYGILEPQMSCPVVDWGEIDWVVVPGLAFDRRGARLGRGAGYYDRNLSQKKFKGKKVGFFYSCQEVSQVPEDEWDVRLDCVVTDKDFLRISI